MKVVLDTKTHTCTVTREASDPKYRDGGWGNAESRLLYHVQQELKKQGHDIIKKRMWKDGHLMDDLQQYLRTRNAKSKRPHVYVWDTEWAISSSADEFNTNGTVTFKVETNVFNEPPKDEDGMIICPKCQTRSFEEKVEPAGDRTSLYCANCGKWIKWITKV